MNLLLNNETASEWFVRTADIIKTCFTDEGFTITRQDSMGMSADMPFKGVFVQAFHAPGSLVVLTAHSNYGVDLSYVPEAEGYEASKTLTECRELSAIKAFIRACHRQNGSN